MSADFLTFLPHLSRLDAPKPKSSHSDNDLPEDYPVVKNMLHRLTGKGTEGTPPSESPSQACSLLSLKHAQGFFDVCISVLGPL